MTAVEPRTYESLKVKIGEEATMQLFEFLNGKVDEKIVSVKGNIVSKHDLAETKYELIKWMFLFWAGQVAATVAIIKLLH